MGHGGEVSGYRITSERDGVAGHYRTWHPVPTSFTFAGMLRMTSDIANQNGYPATLLDEECEEVCTIEPDTEVMP